jgi:Cu+-exporting ATPase
MNMLTPMPNRATADEISVDLAIEGMTCASCSGRVERALRKLDGVGLAEVNLASETARVVARGVDAAAMIAAVERAGYGAHVIDPAGDADEAALRDRAARRDYAVLAVSAVLTAPLVIGMIADLAWARFMLPGWLALALATPVQFWIGARFYRAGYKALRAGSANMDVLVALGTSAAYGMSLYLLVRSWMIGGQPVLDFDSSTGVITLIRSGLTQNAWANRSAIGALAAITRRNPGKLLRSNAFSAARSGSGVPGSSALG